jgi:hypothetical protein
MESGHSPFATRPSRWLRLPRPALARGANGISEIAPYPDMTRTDKTDANDPERTYTSVSLHIVR